MPSPSRAFSNSAANASAIVRSITNSGWSTRTKTEPRPAGSATTTAGLSHTQPTPLKTPHLTEELRIQEPEFRRRMALHAIPDSGFSENSRSDRGEVASSSPLVGPAGPWELPDGRGSVGFVDKLQRPVNSETRSPLLPKRRYSILSSESLHRGAP